jgi:molecular chaperone DnaJ
MENKDYYGMLEVAKNATKDDIKKAYRKLAHKYHPDKKGGDESKFKEINEAYYVLGDEKRRAEYDRYGRVFSGAGGGRQGFDASGFDGFDFSGFSGDFSDIFGDIFGFGQQRGRQQRRGRDISIDLELSFEDSVFGTKRKILLTKMSSCPACQGKGAEPGSKTETCQKCQGSGKVKENRATFFGTFQTVKSCDSCKGTGKTFSAKCKECKGEGLVKKPEEINIETPPGIYEGEMIKLTGKGEAVFGGIPGDLYVKIHIKKHPFFKREGSSLTMDMEIPLSEALLGSEKTVKTLDGNIQVKIPAGINYGEVLRVRDKGIPSDSGRRGDLLIRVLVKIPKNLSKKARKIVEELREEGI